MWHQESKERERRQSDDKHKTTCTGEDKLDDTDRYRRGQRKKQQRTHNKAERDVINQNLINKCTADEVQELKFQFWRDQVNYY